MKSNAWGGLDVPISQGFNQYNAEYDASGGYDYVTAYGLEKGHHGGIDIAVDKGTKLFALNPGTVVRSGFSDSFRPAPVWIETEDNPDTRTDEAGYTEIWGHMWTNAVGQGDSVKPGQLLGTSGEQTVRGTWNPDGSGPHLHFELRRGRDGGKTIIDPTRWLSGGVTPGEGEPDAAPDDSDQDGGGGGDLLGGLTDLGKRAGIAILGGLLLLLGVFILVADRTPIGRAVARLRGK